MSPKKRRQSHASNTRNILIGRKPVTIEGEEVVPTRYLPNNRVVTSKYTLLNFLPKNLFEQFRRLANFYFLCIAVIQVTTNSPVSPITSLAPLMFVVTTTALKQGYEDWLRHRTDRQTNRRMFPVLVNDKLRDLRSEVIRVGDVVMVKGNEEIPCDMVLVSCHSSQGRCHVTTANLDGETNLKVRDCLPATKDLKTEESLKSLTGIIQCEKPNTDLYEFVGNFKLVQETNVQTFPLSSSNLLVRGSRLQNCPFVYGIAVYTGPETKMALNSRVTSSKFSSVEKAANKYLVTYLMLLVIFAGTATIVRMLLQDDPVMGTPWYIEPLILKDKTISVSYSCSRQIRCYKNLFCFLQMFFVINEFLAFFVIFNYIIPISLYVTLGE
jgi:phospholipid-translocating ATPase